MAAESSACLALPVIDGCRFLQCDLDSPPCRPVSDAVNARSLEHSQGSDVIRGIPVFVIGIDHGADPGLNDGLGAFIAWEERYIQRGAFKTGAAVIQDCVQLTVDGIRILCLQLIAVVRAALPRKFIIRAAGGKAVIADGQDLVVRTDDARADLGIGIL